VQARRGAVSEHLNAQRGAWRARRAPPKTPKRATPVNEMASGGTSVRRFTSHRSIRRCRTWDSSLDERVGVRPRQLQGALPAQRGSSRFCIRGGARRAHDAPHGAFGCSQGVWVLAGRLGAHRAPADCCTALLTTENDPCAQGQTRTTFGRQLPLSSVQSSLGKTGGPEAGGSALSPTAT
jgi:hypothetical protein